MPKKQIDKHIVEVYQELTPESRVRALKFAQALLFGRNHPCANTEANYAEKEEVAA